MRLLSRSVALRRHALKYRGHDVGELKFEVRISLRSGHSAASRKSQITGLLGLWLHSAARLNYNRRVTGLRWHSRPRLRVKALYAPDQL